MRINSINNNNPKSYNPNNNVYFGKIMKNNVLKDAIATKDYLVVISGPSGVGKDTILRNLAGKFNKIVTYTTREPRPGEKEGVDYFYTTVEKFKEAIANNEFVEYVKNFGNNFYGTKKSTVIDTMKSSDKPLVLNINVDGAKNVKESLKDKVNVVSIFIEPPSIHTLLERLQKRGTESAEKIAERVGKAQSEIDQADSFDVIIRNDEAKDSAKEIAQILNLK